MEPPPRSSSPVGAPPQGCPVQHRLEGVMLHVPWYSVQGVTRLARDAGVSHSAVSRLLAGETSPSFALLWKLTKALEQRLGRRLDPRELVSLDGSYPTPSTCALCGCAGCLPPQAYTADDTLKPEWRHVRPGEWSSPHDPPPKPQDSPSKPHKP